MNAPPTTDARSDPLLRTLAAVPVSSAILDLACGAGQHTEALLRLGFPVHACDPRPDAIQKTQARVRERIDAETAQSCVQERSLERLDALDARFDWIVADRAEAFIHSEGDLPTLLQKSRRLLNPGGWLYLTVPASSAEDGGPSSVAPCGFDERGVRFSPSDLEAHQFDAELAESRPPTRVEENGEVRIRALYRRVDARAPGRR